MSFRCYKSYLDLCQPYALPAPWHTVASASDAYIIPCTLDEMLFTLRSMHPIQELTDSGLAECSSDGAAVWNPRLSCANEVILAVRDPVSGEVNDLVTDAGCVRSRRPPIFSLAGDQHAFDALCRPNRSLLLTDSIANVALLRSFGLAAAPVCGLSTMNEADVNLLCKYFDLERRSSERETSEDLANSDPGEKSDENGDAPVDPLKGLFSRAKSKSPADPLANTKTTNNEPLLLPSSGLLGPDEKDPILLTFVGWSPQTMSHVEPQGVNAAIDFLIQLNKFRGLEIYTIQMWFPSASNWQAIEFALKSTERKWVQDALLDSIYGDHRHLDSQVHSALAVQPLNLVSAIEAVQDVLQQDPDQGFSRERRKKVMRDYKNVIQQQLVSPLLVQAQSVADPVDRTLQTQFAQLAALFADKMLRVREQMSRDPAADSGVASKSSDRSVEELLAISSQMVTLIKETSRWKHPNRSTSNPRTRPLPINSPRFGRLDLATRN